MILSDMEFGMYPNLVVPFDDSLVQPASIDLRLGGKIIDPATDETFHTDYILEPGGFVIGCTIETLNVPLELAARFEGKSSLGRIGLATHVTAGFIDPGFSGQITVELANVSRKDIKLLFGMRIGQVCFMRMSLHPSAGYGSDRYGSHYQGQMGPTLARS